MKLSEFKLIELLAKKLPTLPPEVTVGIGDDTAVIKKDEGYLLLTSDALVEGSHFLKEWKEKLNNFYYYLGRKLLSISLSDIASMGGIPEYAIVNIGLSEKTETEEMEELYEGLADCCREFSVTVVGGDTVSSKTEFFDVTLTGKCKNFMLRSEAKPGELVAVTGTFGDSRAGLEILKGKGKEDNYLLERFLNPIPRVKEGVEARNLGVKCGTDVSDGLVFNLYTIANSSNVSIHIEGEKIPISRELLNFVGNSEIALNYALFGGEDYELIITLPENLQDKVESLGFKVIGEVKEGTGVFLDGERLPEKGYDHFKT
ncbi:thiamine-phosphate kinase [Phorcysia thermohydrogeniphila]|uniref:Thiamine-monophosphate kinase n=1 Tax=Phorcysia thermohydrogeniphila TaxID=936138 RepID=A0A4V2PDR4_9BACT|nr:thiamine-phosphate kinase [Phorcysia thermohydrogeniphila]TCK06276.1 thiamine-monophosphate kinase [Phorcysia thermohydrogeniphila]